MSTVYEGKTGRKFFSFIQAEDGLSLIEVSIALIIISMIMVPLMSSYRAKYVAHLADSAVGGIMDASDAINSYHQSGNESYPCPANLAATPGDDDYGHAPSPCVLTDFQLCSDNSWLNKGICKTSNDTDTAVLIGALPVADLKLSDGQDIDPWGNKYIYAVSMNTTDSSTFSETKAIIPIRADLDINGKIIGYIQIKDETGDLTYEYLIFSTGETGQGGFTKNGVRVSECSNPGDEFSDLENCDFDSTFLLRDDLASQADNFYDDYIYGQVSLSETIWYKNQAESSTAMTMASHVGIGTQLPKQALHVSGRYDGPADVLIEPYTDSDGTVNGGDLKTSSLCNNAEIGNEVCFTPDLIAGDKEEMDCGDDTLVVRKLSNGRVICNSTADIEGKINDAEKLVVEGLSGNCTEKVGEEIVVKGATGIDASGALKCN